jgi:hypothetical protein
VAAVRPATAREIVPDETEMFELAGSLAVRVNVDVVLVVKAPTVPDISPVAVLRVSPEVSVPLARE